MWKVLLTLGGQRTLLILVALITINFHLPAKKQSVISIHPVSELWGHFIAQIEGPSNNSAAVVTVARPFQWFTAFFTRNFGIPFHKAALILANLFLLLFLYELFKLCDRLVTTDIAYEACALAILWPTSYHLSLGVPLSLTCYLMTVSFRHALDNQWFLGGLTMGLFVVADPISFGVLPFFIAVFWYFQRHFMMAQVIKHTLFFLLPVVAAIYFKYGGVPDIIAHVHGSALVSIVGLLTGLGHFSINVKALLMPMLVIGFLALGATFAMMSHTLLLYKILPAISVLSMLIFSSINQLESRALLAAPCFIGIASACSPLISRFLRLAFLALGAWEVSRLFR